jgi:hypothetical protein
MIQRGVDGSPSAPTRFAPASFVPIYVAFAFPGVAWLLVAVGLRRAGSRAS